MLILYSNILGQTGDAISLIDKFLDKGGPGYALAVFVIIIAFVSDHQKEKDHTKQIESLIVGFTERTESFKDFAKEVLAMIERWKSQKD